MAGVNIRMISVFPSLAISSTWPIASTFNTLNYKKAGMSRQLNAALN